MVFIRGKRSRASGSSLVEYGMLGVLITVACFTAMQFLGGQISRIVIDSCNALSNVIQGMP